MPRYTRESCRTSFSSAARPADVIDRARRPAPIRMAASADHQRIVDRVAEFMARGRPDEVARLDVERWRHDGGSFKRSPREREGEIRRTRTEGERRAIRARQSKDVRDGPRSFGRRREVDQRSFPGGARVTRFAERVKRLSRS
jgi:hypothetical protein